nr:DUF1636 family protein [uncultured Ruegeria sp.]
MSDATDHILLICSTCNGDFSADKIRSSLLDALPSRFAIRSVDCMAGCARPTTVGFQATGKAQYLFGDIRTPHDIAALAEFALQYQNSADGWTCASDRPSALFDKTLSRLPRMILEEPS